ncbi:MAG: hypothetical protein WC356_07665 [Candidatus Micrarchaeia archaeon]
MTIQMCMWAKSSTNMKTMKGELPESCVKKGCKGFFKEGVKPDCEDYMPVPKSLEKEFKDHFGKLILE